MAFSNEIKTVLSLDEKDWKKALDTVRKVEKEYFREASVNTEKLGNAKENLAKLEKQQANDLIQSTKKIAEIEEKLSKARKKNKTENIKKHTESLRYYKQLQKEIKASATIEINETKEAINQLNRKTQAQEKYTAALKKAEQHYQQRAEFESKYNKPTEQQKYNKEIDNLNRLQSQGIITLQEKEKALKQVNKEMISGAGATDSMTNSVVRHLRQIETLIVTYFMLKTAWDSTIGVGIEVNKIIESNTYGIAALVSANTQMTDSLGNVLNASEKFQMAQITSKDALVKLKKEALETPATFKEMVEIYQQAIGQTLGAGDAFGESVQEISDNTVALSKRMSNFASSIGMPMDRVREEIRSMLSGNASTDSLISTIIFGSPGEANKAIRRAGDQAGGLVKLLNEKFKPFDILADTRTYEKGLAQLKGAWESAMGDMLKKSEMFSDITDLFYEMSSEIRSDTDAIVESFDKVYSIVKEAGDVLGNLVVPAAAITGTYALTAAVLALTKAMKANPYLWAGAGILAGGSYLMEYFEEAEEKAKTLTKALSFTPTVDKKDIKSELSVIDKAIKNTKKDLEKMSEDVFNTTGLEKYFSIFESDKDNDAEWSKYNALRKQLEELEKTREEKAKIVGLDKESIESAKKEAKSLKDKVALQMNLKIPEGEQEKLDKLIGGQSKLNKLLEQQKDVEKSLKAFANAKRLAGKDGNISKEEQEQLDKINITLERKKELEKQITAERAKSAQKTANDQARLLKSRYDLEESEAKLNGTQTDKLSYLNDLLKIKEKEISDNQTINAGEITHNKLLADKNKILANIQQTKQSVAVQDIKDRMLGILRDSDANDDSLISDEEYEATKQKLYQLQVEMAKSKDILGVDKGKLQQEFEDAVASLSVDDLPLENEIEFRINFTGFDEVSSGIASVLNGMQDMQDATKEYNKILSKQNATQAEITQGGMQYASLQIGNVANMTGAMASFYDEDDDRRKKQLEAAKVAQAAQMALQIAQMAQSTAFTGLFVSQEAVKATAAGTTAVAVAAQSSPWTGLATGAAMAAMLASFGIMLSGGSGGTNTSSIVQNPNSTTVFGGGDEQSESISNSLKIIEDYAKPDNFVLNKMAEYLESIEKGINGLSKDVIRTGEFALGAGAKEFQITQAINESELGDDIILGGSTITGGVLGSVFGPAGTAIGATIGATIGSAANAIDKIIADTLGMGVGDALGKIGGALGLGGGGYNWQMLADSGIQFGNVDAKSGSSYSGMAGYYGHITTMRESEAQTLAEAINDFKGMLFQNTAAESMSKSRWGSASYSYYSSTKYQDMDKELSNSLEKTFANIANTIIYSSAILGEDVAASLMDIELTLDNIDLKGKTGEEIQEAFNEAFSEQSDIFTDTVLDGTIERFQDIGEGLFETLVRVAGGIAEADYYAKKLQISATEYGDIIDTFGDVGFESLSQSIVKLDESIYGLDNGVVQIIESMSSSAEDLYETYITLEKTRRMIMSVGQDASGLSQSMIAGAGGYDELNDALESYFENFLNESERVAFLTDDMTREFERLNLSLPTGRDGFINLLNSIDLTTASGQDLYGRLVNLSDGFAELEESSQSLLGAEVSNALEMAELERQLQEEQLDLYDSSITAVKDLSSAFETMGNSIEDTIAQLLGSSDSVDAQSQLIETFWTKREEIDSLMEKQGDLTDTEKGRLQQLVGDVQSLSTNIQSATFGDNSIITDELVNELGILKDELNFQDEIIKAQIVDINGNVIGVAEEDGILTQLKESLEKKTPVNNLSFGDFKEGGALSVADEIQFRQSFQAESAASFSEELEKLRSSLSYLSLETTNATDYMNKLSDADSVSFGNVIEFFKDMGVGVQRSGAWQTTYQEDYRDLMNFEHHYDAINELYKIAKATDMSASTYQNTVSNILHEYLGDTKPYGNNPWNTYTKAYTDKSGNTVGSSQTVYLKFAGSESYYDPMQQSVNRELAQIGAGIGFGQDVGLHEYVSTDKIMINGYEIELPSYDVGTTSVPKDMIAQIHKNEMITPAPFADGIRNGSLTLGNNKDIIASINNQTNEIKRLNNRLEKIEMLNKDTRDNTERMAIGA